MGRIVWLITSMEEVSQAAIDHVLGDEQLLVLLVEVGDDGEEVGVGERRRMCSEKSFSSCCASPPALPPDPAAMASS